MAAVPLMSAVGSTRQYPAPKTPGHRARRVERQQIHGVHGHDPREERESERREKQAIAVIDRGDFTVDPLVDEFDKGCEP